MAGALIFIYIFNIADTLQFTINEAIEYAYNNNAEVRQLVIELNKSSVDIGIARSAFYPVVTSTGYYAYLSELSIFQMDTIAIPMGQHENYNFQVSLQQVLFAWGKIYDAYRIAGLNRDIAELKLVRKKQEVRCSVIKSYYGLLVLEKMVELTKESMEQLKRHEESVRKRYEAGLVSQFDLLRARVQVANLKPRLIEAENGLRLAREGFKILLGLPQEIEFKLIDSLEITEEDFDLEFLKEEALKNRAELKNLEKLKKISTLAKTIKARANLPTLFAGVSYERKKPFSFGGNDWGSSLTFNIGFQFPIFSGYKNLYDYDKSKLQLKEVELAYENLTKGIILEVKQSYFNLNSAREEIVAAKENITQAEKALNIMETRYKNGLATNLEYLDTQLATMQAKINYLNALKDYLSARADLIRAVGYD
ncbi:MAG: TolC family protein [candidate division WOR-3 bacterium]|nr:TolC family protein [candidate division WOR-3 bacterium]